MEAREHDDWRDDLVCRTRPWGVTVDLGLRIMGPGSSGQRHRSLPANIGIALQRADCETDDQLMQMRAWYAEAKLKREALAARLERDAAAKRAEATVQKRRTKKRVGRCQKRHNQQASRQQDADADGVAAAEDIADDVGDGAADGAMAPISQKKEKLRREAANNLLQDWIDKAGLERDKVLLQREEAKLRFDRAIFWGMLMEECGQERTAPKSMAPLLLVLGEACLFLQRNKSLGKLERERFLQKLFDETDATLHELLQGWIAIVDRYKKIRRSVAAAVGAAAGKRSRSSKSRRQGGNA